MISPIAPIIAWLKAKYIALLTGAAAVAAVVARMLWLKGQRDLARVERDNAEVTAAVERRRSQIAAALNEVAEVERAAAAEEMKQPPRRSHFDDPDW